MKKRVASILLAMGTIPLVVSAYTLTINVDGTPTDYTVDSATVSSNTAGMLLTVTGLDTPPPPPPAVDPVAPVVETSKLSITEGATTISPSISVSDANGDTTTLALSGGADKAFFNLSGKTLRFKVAPDYGVPGSKSGDNNYKVRVTATDSTSLSSASTLIIVTVNPDDGTTEPTSCGSVPKNVKINTSHPLAKSTGWTVSVPNTTLEIATTDITSIKVHTTTSKTQRGTVGWAQDGNTPSVERTLWISECPGGPVLVPENYDPKHAYAVALGNPCTDSWVSNSNITYSQAKLTDPLDIYQDCALIVNKDYYVNIKNEDCTKSICNVRLGTALDSK